GALSVKLLTANVTGTRLSAAIITVDPHAGPLMLMAGVAGGAVGPPPPMMEPGSHAAKPIANTNRAFVFIVDSVSSRRRGLNFCRARAVSIAPSHRHREVRSAFARLLLGHLLSLRHVGVLRDSSSTIVTAFGSATEESDQSVHAE